MPLKLRAGKRRGKTVSLELASAQIRAPPSAARLLAKNVEYSSRCAVFGAPETSTDYPRNLANFASQISLKLRAGKRGGKTVAVELASANIRASPAGARLRAKNSESRARCADFGALSAATDYPWVLANLANKVPLKLRAGRRNGSSGAGFSHLI